MNKTVEVKFIGGKKIEAEVDGMALRTEQSRENGGERSALGPLSLFLFSLEKM